MIVFEPLPPEQWEHLPYWTTVDQVAQISPSELVGFCRPYLDKLNYLVKQLPKSTLLNGRRVFDTAQTPTRISSPRTVTFSPRVDVQPIEKNKRHHLVENNSGDQQTKVSQPKRSESASPLSHVIDNSGKSKPQTQSQGESLSQQPKENVHKSPEELELLREELLDLVPPDFDIMFTDPNKIYTASASNDCDSDSVSYFSSDSDDD